jgi:hypothetical protein
MSMTKLQRLELEVKELSADDRAAFRRWFEEFDADEWDRQIEADVQAGKLDALAERALRDHAAGRSREL